MADAVDEAQLGDVLHEELRLRRCRFVMHYALTWTVLCFCIVSLWVGYLSTELEYGIYGMLGTIVGIELKRPKLKKFTGRD